MMGHVIFFDATCPFCRHWVANIYSWDKKGIFCFAPLTGKTAQVVLKKQWEALKNENTVVLAENCHLEAAAIWIRGRAACRILWLLGGWKKIFGIFALLPCGVDAVYSFIATRRHRLNLSSFDELPKNDDRFLE